MNECCPHEVQINTSANKIKVQQYIPGTAHRKTKETKRGKEERAKHSNAIQV
jgi:hypothetical protein